MTTFQRARSEEQREVRRNSILDIAAEMLTEMPVADMTLNDLSRRVGLAKSNIMRYFESREAVLLELLDQGWKSWLTQLPEQLSAAVTKNASTTDRARQVATVLSWSVNTNRTFCDLLSAQAAVLERNVSSDVAARYKRNAMADVAVLAELVEVHLPELNTEESRNACGAIVMLTGAIWTHSQPSSGMLAAYDADPDLASMRMQFIDTLEGSVTMILLGALSLARHRTGIR